MIEILQEIKRAKEWKVWMSVCVCACVRVFVCVWGKEIRSQRLMVLENVAQATSLKRWHVNKDGKEVKAWDLRISGGRAFQEVEKAFAKILRHDPACCIQGPAFWARYKAEGQEVRQQGSCAAAHVPLGGCCADLVLSETQSCYSSFRQIHVVNCFGFFFSLFCL